MSPRAKADAYLKDSIHGKLYFKQDENDFIRTSEVQRLRHVKQLGLAYLMYPSATHSKFEHALGSAHTAKKMCNSALKDEHTENKMGSKLAFYASLLRGTGHGPFPQVFSRAVEKFKGKNPETYVAKKILSKGRILGDVSLYDLLIQNDVRPKDVAYLICPKCAPDVAKDKPVLKGLEILVNGPISAHGLDFMIRDSYYTGIPVGHIDIDDLLLHVSIEIDENDEWKVVLDTLGIAFAENVFMARNVLYYLVYRHPIIRIAESMLRKALELYMEEGKGEKIDQFRVLSDWQILTRLRDFADQDSRVSELIKCLDFRLYAPLLFLTKSELEERGLKLLQNKREEIEEQICSEYDEGDIIVDLAIPRISVDFDKVFVRKDPEGKTSPLKKHSSIVEGLAYAEKRLNALGIYYNPAKLQKSKRNKVLKTIAEFLGYDKKRIIAFSKIASYEYDRFMGVLQ